MAAPHNVTIQDLSGIWRIQSRTRSDDMNPGLILQGVPWVIRKAISWATITGKISQIAAEDGVTTVTIAQTATGGLKGETEVYKLDGSEATTSTPVFGVNRIRASWSDLRTEKPLGLSGEPLPQYLMEGWLEQDDLNSPGHITAHVVCDRGGWTVDQIWGFSLVAVGNNYGSKLYV
ncbi:hypothetical protein DL771_008218 [Monosporascus sp. 5C6A]|nr:hypothetical protein DL771_008218 [Monosporascus sp. 5C6A]